MEAITTLLSGCWNMMKTSIIPGLGVSVASFLIASFMVGFAVNIIAKFFNLNVPITPLTQFAGERRKPYLFETLDIRPEKRPYNSNQLPEPHSIERK